MSTPNTSIDPDRIMVSTILANLHVISMIGSKDKLCTSQPLFNLNPPSPFRSLYRSWYGEERMKNVEDVQQCIKLARDSLEEYKNDEHLFRRMMESLMYACKGIVVLMDTYATDASCVAKLRVMLDDIKNLSHPPTCIQLQDGSQIQDGRRVTSSYPYNPHFPRIT